MGKVVKTLEIRGSLLWFPTCRPGLLNPLFSSGAERSTVSCRKGAAYYSQLESGRAYNCVHHEASYIHSKIAKNASTCVLLPEVNLDARYEVKAE